MGKVMVVDDAVSELKVIESILKAAGHQVVSYQDGELLEDRVVEERPDVLLLDIVIYLSNVHARLSHAVGKFGIVWWMKRATKPSCLAGAARVHFISMRWSLSIERRHPAKKKMSSAKAGCILSKT